MTSTRGARSDVLTSRGTIPVVTSGRGGKGNRHGFKLGVGLVTLTVIGGMAAVAGFSAVRSIGKGDGLSAADEYLAGQGEVFISKAGRFRVELPAAASEPRTDTIEIFGGDVEIQGVRAPLGDDDNTYVHVSWFDLPNAPAAKDAAGLLAAVAVFRADKFESSPTHGRAVEGARYPGYEYELELSVDAAAGDAVSEFVVERLVLVRARMYVLWIDGARAEHDLLEHLAATFKPRAART
jgi:hypothetical protein